MPIEAADGGVRVLARGLALLRAFGPRNAAMSNSDLAAITALPKATVSRLTASLTRLGYLDYLNASGQYRLGLGAVALGYGVLSSLDMRVRARAHMQRFAQDKDLLVVLAVREGLHMVCHEVCRGRGALTIRVGVGSRLALPYSAMGRAWMRHGQLTRTGCEQRGHARGPARCTRYLFAGMLGPRVPLPARTLPRRNRTRAAGTAASD